MSSLEGVSERRHSMDLRYKALEARKLSYNSIPPSKVTGDDEIKRWTVESDVTYGLVQQEEFDPAAEIMERCFKKYRIGSRRQVSLPMLSILSNTWCLPDGCRQSGGVN